MSLPTSFSPPSITQISEQFSNSTSSLEQAIHDFVSGDYGLDFKGGTEVQHILAVGYLVLGLLLVYLGCRLFKFTLFALTFTGVTGLSYYIGMHQGYDTKAVFGVSICIGFLCGFLALKLFKLSIFAIGVFVGFIVWLTMKSLWPELLAEPITSYTALAIPCIILGCFSLYLEQYWLLIATPVLGTFLFWQGLDHFAHLDLNVFGTIAGQDECTSKFCYYYYAGMIAMCLSGFIVQYYWTGKFIERTRVKVQKVVVMPTPMKEIKTVN
jgi:hypothetical protein